MLTSLRHVDCVENIQCTFFLSHPLLRSRYAQMDLLHAYMHPIRVYDTGDYHTTRRESSRFSIRLDSMHRIALSRFLSISDLEAMRKIHTQS